MITRNRIRATFFTLCALLATLCGTSAKAQTATLVAQSNNGGVTDHYVTPKRVVWISDSTGHFVRHADRLIRPFSGQVSVADTAYTVMQSTTTHKAGVLVDFGRELHGALEIASAIRPEHAPVSLRVRLGESVTEALSADGEKRGATNDHAMRDFILPAPWLGNTQTGNTGFRFAYIEVEDTAVRYNLRAVRAIARYQDAPWLGFFMCDNALLTDIWNTGAYTVQQCMQQYIWDGIKRDRLVWMGDFHPELMTILSVFGHNDAIERSLNFAEADAPLPSWMNGSSAYSLWWLLCQRDFYLYRGNLDYLKMRQPYMKELLKQVCSHIDNKGQEHLDGFRFLDWPTFEMTDVIASGMRSLCYMALNAGAEMERVLGDDDMVTMCRQAAERLRKRPLPNYGNKEAAALRIISGLSKGTTDRDVLLKGGPRGFSTFYGYYMLEGLAREGRFEEAVDIIKKYWGGMLNLGATTFWEDFDYDDLARASRIDSIVPAGQFDIHADRGTNCYKGLRMSLCHGWASGVTAWLSRYVLGIMPTEAGCRAVTIEPHLAGCNEVLGSFPTPFGIITVNHRRAADGTIYSIVEAPEGVRVTLKGAVAKGGIKTDGQTEEQD